MKSEIPFGAQFSPNQVDLVELLELALSHSGNRKGLTDAIQKRFFSSHAVDQRHKLADNVVLSMRAYGLLEEKAATPTELTRKLWSLRGNPNGIYSEFARHILLNLRGIEYIETVKALQRAGKEVTLNTLRNTLVARGINVPRGTVHLSSMRLWLSKAGIFDEEAKRRDLYDVNEERLESILGVDLDAIERLSSLNEMQRAYLRALVRLSGETPPFVANKVADLAETLYGVSYNHKQLPKDVLFTLRDLGYLTLEKQTAGRGAKPYLVRTTEKFEREISEPLLEAAARNARLVPSEFISLSLSRILGDLSSSDTYTKGKALELLVIYLSRLLDLDFKGWRLRSSDTGGAEVDVILEGARLIFSRWQVQAKNTSVVHLDDLAKEVGLSLTFLYSNVVMAVTTGRFTKDAIAYATHVMKNSNLHVILLDGKHLERIAKDPTDIARILNSKAREAMQIKARDFGK